MQTNSIATYTKQRVSNHQVAAVFKNQNDHHQSLHAMVSLKPGEVISKFTEGITQNFATYLTIQTGTDTHITLVPEFLQFTNHSCNPTAFFDTTNMELVCLEPLQEGDEITFFYPSTEWEMAQPFVCNCGNIWSNSL